MLEWRLRDSRGAEELAELVEADLFADVELDEDADGAGEGTGARRGL
jgi:hypothetical protein